MLKNLNCKNVRKNCTNIWSLVQFCITFVNNKTHHASHWNSAPGWVFDFYRGRYHEPSQIHYTYRSIKMFHWRATCDN